MSAITADAIVIPGLAKKPAKNRQTITDAILFEKPVPSTKSSSAVIHTLYTPERPKCSLNVDVTMDPRARPKLYIGKGTTATVAEMAKSCCNFSRAGAMVLDANVLLRKSQDGRTPGFGTVEDGMWWVCRQLDLRDEREYCDYNNSCPFLPW